MSAKQSNVMWNILLATEKAAKELAGSILTTESVSLQTEYMGTRKMTLPLETLTVTFKNLLGVHDTLIVEGNRPQCCSCGVTRHLFKACPGQ